MGTSCLPTLNFKALLFLPLGTKVPESNCFDYGGQLVAHHTVLIFAFPSPVHRLDISPTSGGLGEHCLSSAVRHGLCASLGRVAQPRLLAKYRGNPEGAVNRGRLLWVTFLGKTRKVTCCRATHGGVEFEFENPRASPILLRTNGVFQQIARSPPQLPSPTASSPCRRAC